PGGHPPSQGAQWRERFTERPHRYRLRVSDLGGCVLSGLADGLLFRRGCATVRFSGVADAQLKRDVREYTAVYGCVRVLTTAVVAVTVAVGDTSGPPASQAGSRIKAGRCSASLALPYSSFK